MSPTVTIHDATILIDLIRIDLLSLPFDLNVKYKTTQLAFDELRANEQNLYLEQISKGALSVESCSLDEISLTSKELSKNPRFCLQDLIAVQLAMSNKAMLLSNSKLVQELAITKGIATHNVVWLLDELYRQVMIDGLQASKYLKSLIKVNPRIMDDSCTKRFITWQNAKSL